MSTWLPDATRVPAYRDAGPMDPRCVLWVDAGLGEDYSAALAAKYANAYVRAPHLIIDPRTDEVIQMVPATRRAMWISSDGIQVLVLAPDRLFPPKGQDVGARSALGRVMSWVRLLGVPNFSPLGPPVPTHPKHAGSVAGHYSSEGKIDVNRLLV